MTQTTTLTLRKNIQLHKLIDYLLKLANEKEK